MSAKPQMKKIAEEKVFERKLDFRSEEEAGATLSHNRITRNLGGLLWQHLRGKTCESFTSDMAVKVKRATGEYSFPDIVAVCDDAVFSNTKDGKSQVENPVLIIEVLSKGSQEDLSTKFEEYKQLASLIEYVVIFQNSFELIYYFKRRNNKWIEECRKKGEDTILFLRSIGLAIRLKEIYEKCDFVN